ncbi:putative RNA-directed DNA polymerase from transposon X-element [Trichonephila clavipes]|nr:putative RNA-directed DNA polymerase from transposon X-element [Trichonephila clavipes]
MPENLGSSMCLQSHRQLPVNSYGERLHYTWTIYRSAVKVRTCMLERQLQTAVNNIVKCSDVRFLGVIFDRRLTFLPHILHLRKRCEKSLNLLEGVGQTPLWGADRTSLPECIRQSCSRIDYGCCIRISVQLYSAKLDPVHHMALRICSGAFRTSAVQSFYVIRHQLPLDFRRRKLSLAFYFKILSVPSYPLQNVYMSTSMKRLCDARPSQHPAVYG